MSKKDEIIMRAWVDRDGRFHFALRNPGGLLPVLKTCHTGQDVEEYKKSILKHGRKVGIKADDGASAIEFVVPGVYEAKSDQEALEAMFAFNRKFQ
jgi:hypothetical protein